MPTDAEAVGHTDDARAAARVADVGAAARAAPGPAVGHTADTSAEGAPRGGLVESWPIEVATDLAAVAVFRWREANQVIEAAPVAVLVARPSGTQRLRLPGDGASLDRPAPGDVDLGERQRSRLLRAAVRPRDEDDQPPTLMRVRLATSLDEAPVAGSAGSATDDGPTAPRLTEAEVACRLVSAGDSVRLDAPKIG
ncbi:MAG: hypothetical protein ACK2UL_04055 [Anaerolineae bacterium]